MTIRTIRCFLIGQVILMLATFSELLLSDACYVAYLFIIIPAFLCLYLNSKQLSKSWYSLNKPVIWLGGIFSALFSLMVTLANYKIWDLGRLYEFIIVLIIFLGSFFAFGNILLCIALNAEKVFWGRQNRFWKPLSVFLISFSVISVINLLVLFLCKYPGNLSPDSIVQMSQLLTNQYSNHHPFWHTLTIKVFITMGLRLFDDINMAVALYSTFSVLFMAASFSFAIATVDELHPPKWIVALLILFFALMPYNIVYSITMWKDILFGAFVLLFSVFFFRCITRMSLKQFNYIGLMISGLGFCLFRSNGYFAFVFTALFFFIFWKLRSKKILFIILSILLCSFILKHPVLKALNVTQPDLIESLSIPAQQIARDVIDNNDLTDDENNLLSKVVDIDKMPEEYIPYISDRIKNLFRAKGNQDYIKENASAFIGFYFSRAMKHPFTYLKGWIDETRGYWNAGYSYIRWIDGIHENDLGIHRTVRSEGMNNLVNRYLGWFENHPILQIFLCIGFFDWFALIALFVTICKKDKIGAMLVIPLIMVVLSLLVATPVFSEFRYVYAVFCALPIVLVLLLRPDSIFFSDLEKDLQKEAEVG